MGEAPVDSWDHQANKALMFSEDKKDKELIATLALLCQSNSVGPLRAKSEKAWEYDKEQRHSNPRDLEGLTATHPEPTPPTHPWAWHFPGEIMYKHLHTCWRHSHLMLPVTKQVSQFPWV